MAMAFREMTQQKRIKRLVRKEGKEKRWMQEWQIRLKVRSVSFFAFFAPFAAQLQEIKRPNA